MSDRSTTHVVGHTITKEGMVLPFHFTLADNAGLMFSRHGMRDMEQAELAREDTRWQLKRVSDLLDGLRNAPAWIHPDYVPVDTGSPQSPQSSQCQVDDGTVRRQHTGINLNPNLNVQVLPRAELESNFANSLPLGLPTTKVMMRMWDGAFDPPTTSPHTNP